MNDITGMAYADGLDFSRDDEGTEVVRKGQWRGKWLLLAPEGNGRGAASVADCGEPWLWEGWVAQVSCLFHGSRMGRSLSSRHTCWVAGDTDSMVGMDGLSCSRSPNPAG